MAAKLFHSKKGKVRLKLAGSSYNDIPNPVTWTVGPTLETAETTAMSSSNTAKTRVPGFKDWTGSVEVLADADTAPLVSIAEGKNYHVQFWQDAGTAGNGIFHGWAVCTGVSVTAPAPDTVKYVYHLALEG